jgi:hypothetical protein
MMLLISWAGTCKNLEGVWESKCQILKNNIWLITRGMEALKEVNLEKNNGY